MTAKKKALGRGLGALLHDYSPGQFQKQSNENEIKPGNIANISINKIQTNPFQPRTHFDKKTLNELAESIKAIGVIQPITVRKMDDDTFQLISGERRYQASKIAGFDTIPAYIRPAEDEEMLQLALVENIQRENLNAIEIAISFNRLVEDCQLSQEEISKIVGKQRSTVSNYIRLLKLPAAIQLGVKEGRILMGHARAIIAIENPEIQLRLFNQILEKDLSVRKVEELVQELDKPKADKEKPQRADNQLVVKEKELTEKLNLKTKITANNKGGGKVVISYGSEKELSKLFSFLKL